MCSQLSDVISQFVAATEGLERDIPDLTAEAYYAARRNISGPKYPSRPDGSAYSKDEKHEIRTRASRVYVWRSEEMHFFKSVKPRDVCCHSKLSLFCVLDFTVFEISIFRF